MVPQRTFSAAVVGGVFGGLLVGVLVTWLVTRFMQHRQHKAKGVAGDLPAGATNHADKNGNGGSHYHHNSGVGNFEPTSGQMYRPPTELYSPSAGPYHPTHGENTGFHG